MPQSLDTKRTLSNFIHNAVDGFDGKAGTVTIRVHATTEQVQIHITDNGKGMPSSVLEQLRQQISVTADTIEGHGIGMAPVYNTLKACNGIMTLDSQVGQGATIGFFQEFLPHLGFRRPGSVKNKIRS